MRNWDEHKLSWLKISSDNIIDTKYCDCYLKNSESTGFHSSRTPKHYDTLQA